MMLFPNTPRSKRVILADCLRLWRRNRRPNHWDIVDDPVAPLENHLTAIHWQDCHVKEDWKKCCCNVIGTKYTSGNSTSLINVRRRQKLLVKARSAPNQVNFGMHAT